MSRRAVGRRDRAVDAGAQPPADAFVPRGQYIRPVVVPTRIRSLAPRMPKSHFYDLSDAERTAATIESIDARRTMVERWSSLADERPRGWTVRARIAGKWLRDQPAVADLGCGTQVLEAHLAPGTLYLPVDVVARDGRTVVVDLNREPLPRLPVRAAAALGLLEYVFEPEALVAAMFAAFDVVVTSYNPRDLPAALADRHANGWVNAFDQAEFEQLFIRAGYHLDRRYAFDKRQVIWRFTTAKPAPGSKSPR